MTVNERVPDMPAPQVRERTARGVSGWPMACLVLLLLAGGGAALIAACSLYQ